MATPVHRGQRGVEYARGSMLKNILNLSIVDKDPCPLTQVFI